MPEQAWSILSVPVAPLSSSSSSASCHQVDGQTDSTRRGTIGREGQRWQASAVIKVEALPSAAPGLASGRAGEAFRGGEEERVRRREKEQDNGTGDVREGKYRTERLALLYVVLRLSLKSLFLVLLGFLLCSAVLTAFSFLSVPFLGIPVRVIVGGDRPAGLRHALDYCWDLRGNTDFSIHDEPVPSTTEEEASSGTGGEEEGEETGLSFVLSFSSQQGRGQQYYVPIDFEEFSCLTFIATLNFGNFLFVLLLSIPFSHLGPMYTACASFPRIFLRPPGRKIAWRLFCFYLLEQALVLTTYTVYAVYEIEPLRDLGYLTILIMTAVVFLLHLPVPLKDRLAVMAATQVPYVTGLGTLFLLFPVIRSQADPFFRKTLISGLLPILFFGTSFTVEKCVLTSMGYGMQVDTLLFAMYLLTQLLQFAASVSEGTDVRRLLLSSIILSSLGCLLALWYKKRKVLGSRSGRMRGSSRVISRLDSSSRPKERPSLGVEGQRGRSDDNEGQFLFRGDQRSKEDRSFYLWKQICVSLITTNLVGIGHTTSLLLFRNLFAAKVFHNDACFDSTGQSSYWAALGFKAEYLSYIGIVVGEVLVFILIIDLKLGVPIIKQLEESTRSILVISCAIQVMYGPFILPYVLWMMLQNPVC